MVTTEKSLAKLNTSTETKEIGVQIGHHRNDSARPVSFLLESEVNAVSRAAATMRDGRRNELMTLFLFQCCLRISECLQLTQNHRVMIQGNPVLKIIGKGNKPRLVPMPAALSDRFGNYILEAKLAPDEKVFPITRIRAWQIIKQCGKAAGLDNRRIYLHLLRHAGAISRLKKTGNIQSLKTYLGHADHKMTERYLVTLQLMESLEIEGKVQFDR